MMKYLKCWECCRMYGIDKTELRNIYIESIDLDRLKASDAVFSLSDSPMAQPVMLHNSDDIIKLDRLYISNDKLFESFTLDYKIQRMVRIYYTTLNLAVKLKNKKLHNLIPMNCDRYKSKLNIIKEYLANNYGIYISFTEARFRKIEINITESMDYEFEDYRVLFEAIRKERNLRVYPNSSTYESYLKTGTHYYSSKTQELKFYNKSREMNDYFKIKLDDHKIMRLEYKLTGYDKIADKLGTDKVLELTDEAIADFLNESVAVDVFKPIKKYIAKTNKALTKKYKQIKKQCKRGYIREFANYCNSLDAEIFDIQQVLDIAKGDIVKSNNTTRNKKIIDSIISPILKHNLDKFEEFQVKFLINNSIITQASENMQN